MLLHDGYLENIEKDDSILILGCGASLNGSVAGLDYMVEAYNRFTNVTYSDISISDDLYDDVFKSLWSIKNKPYSPFLNFDDENFDYVEYANKVVSHVKKNFVKVDLLKSKDLEKLKKYKLIEINYVLHMHDFNAISRLKIIKKLYNNHLAKDGALIFNGYTGVPYEELGELDNGIKLFNYLTKNEFEKYNFGIISRDEKLMKFPEGFDGSEDIYEVYDEVHQKGVVYPELIIAIEKTN